MSYDFTEIIKKIRKNEAIRNKDNKRLSLLSSLQELSSKAMEYEWQLEHGWFEEAPEKDEYLPTIYGEI